MKFRQGLFHFRWTRCPDGYRVVRGKPLPPPKKGQSFIGTVMKPGWVYVDTLRPRSDRKQDYSAMIEAADIHRQLADLPANEQGAKEFAGRFGLLGGSVANLPSDMPIRDFLALQTSVKKILQSTSHSTSEIVSEFDHEFPFKNTRYLLSMHPGSEITPIFHVIPSNLNSFVILRVASELEGGIEWRRCANPKCENTYQVGEGRGTVSEKRAGTKRKLTCGQEKCRKAVQRLRKRQASH